MIFKTTEVAEHAENFLRELIIKNSALSVRSVVNNNAAAH